MTDNLKQKTISGLTWSFIDNFAHLGLSFFIGIILARLLEPREFGLVGMTTIFIAISQSFIDSGFTQALIRKQNCTQSDYSTVFFFNLAVGIFFFFALFFSAPLISSFFNEPQLTLIVQVLAIGLIINALTIVQRVRLTKEINFKLQTKISIIATILSGTVGIGMAYSGYGVWSLIAKTLTGFAVTSLLLWIWNKWKPTSEFNKQSFKEMFSFGSKLLLGGLIYQAHKNIFLLIIGKYFSATELGYYTRAEQFANLPSQNLTSIIQRVTYPTLTTIEHDAAKLRAAYRRLTKSTFLITFNLIVILASTAETLVLTLIGSKWQPSIIYLQMLCVVVLFFPLHELNVNLLKTIGRSDLILKLETFEKILTIPVIIIGIFAGIKILLIGMMIQTFIAYYLNSTVAGRYINYSFFRILKDILLVLIIGLIIGGIIDFAGNKLNFKPVWKLLLQNLLAFIMFIGIYELFKVEDYLYIKNNFFSYLRNKK